MRQAKLSLHVYPAIRASQAVILRRGPSKWWHLLHWDLDTGIVRPGSWFNGMIYPARCDYSPRGDFFLMVAYKGTNKPVAWTTLCRPPEVRADVFWGQDTAALGGGLFDTRMPIVWINLRQDRNTAEARRKVPYDFGYIDEEHKGYGGLAERLVRDGWSRQEISPDQSLHARLVGPDPSEGPLLPDAKFTQWSMKSPKSDDVLIMEHSGVVSPGALPAPPENDPDPVHYFFLPAGAGMDAAIPLVQSRWAGWSRKGRLCVANQDGELQSGEWRDGRIAFSLVMAIGGLQPPQERVQRATAPPKLKTT